MRGYCVIVLFIVAVVIAIDGAIVDTRQEKVTKSTEQYFTVDDFYADRAAVLAAEASEFLGADEVLDGDEEKARDALQALKGPSTYQVCTRGPMVVITKQR